MGEERKDWQSLALRVNLERTASTVEIPEEYDPLLKVVESRYGVFKRTTELLTELNHPYVNWEYVIGQLKSISVGDFYDYNMHENGREAVRGILSIYYETIRSASSEEIRETGVRYLFDYLNYLFANSREFLDRNIILLPSVVETLLQIQAKEEGLFRKCSNYVKPVLRFIMTKKIDTGTKELGLLLYRIYRQTYTYWLGQPDPSTWFRNHDETPEAVDIYGSLIKPLSHLYLRGLLEKLEAIHQQIGDGAPDMAGYLDLPDYYQVVNGYILIADEIERAEVYAGRQHLLKLDFLFHAINVAGLSDIHGSALREINRCLAKVLREEKPENLDQFIRKVFSLLKMSTVRDEFRSTIIDGITTMAGEVFTLNSHPLVETFIDEMITFGFQYPEIKGFTAEWQVQANPAHIDSLRSWLKVISMKPRWTKKLLSALIINLKLKGVFVRDTDLIQKDISSLLNSDIAPAYNLVKQFLRLMPVYFNEIGAEGELRDTSTKVDELTFRQDKLVYFLRKQSHVESNSLLVPFVEDIFRYWFSGNRECVQPYLPAEVYEEVLPAGEYFDGLHRIFKRLFVKIDNDPRKLLQWEKQRIEKEIQGIRGVTDTDKERAHLTIRFYQLLYKKYNAQHVDLLRDLEGTYLFDQVRINALRGHLKRGNHFRSLVIILDFLAILKDRILSPLKTVFEENIYHKRHIAAGIPSVYGTYHEEKLEAVGLSLRLESLATVLLQEVINSLNLEFITKSTIMKLHKYLWLYVKALDLEGIATEGLAAKMRYITSALKVKLFSIDQYTDIFQFISKGIQDIIRVYYIDAHRPNLPAIIHLTMAKDAPSVKRDMTAEEEEAVYQVSENFIRSLISSAFGLQVLDNLTNNVARTLNTELEKFKGNSQILNLVMTYNPEITITPTYRMTKEMDNQILIGNKGYLLKQLTALGFPVPPGFIITTEVFRAYDAVVGYRNISKDLSKRIYEAVVRLEKVTGRKFGDKRNPLLVSVRSGATVSLPGMMHSFLNVGINESIAEGLSAKADFGWAAWDCYRRFLQTWGMFEGLDRNFFDEIINSFKQRLGIARKIQFSPDQMRHIALAYKEAMILRGIEVPDEPAQQLKKAVLKVFASWYSDQAKIYRHQMHLSDEWGTAVVVQTMVFGNLNENSGSGVIFTRDPKGLSSGVTVYGDFIFGVQGDDIVSGLVQTYPISEKQRIAEKRGSTLSLETRFPQIYAELVRLSEILIYEKGFNHQEVEFTFENDIPKGLYVLQTRDMVQTETKRVRLFKDTEILRQSLMGTGIGVSGGALCGRVVYAEQDIAHFRNDEPKTPLILIRPDTVPDDVGILLKVDGILTARGGGTSHAAVTIPQLNKVGVVGFNKLQVYEARGESAVDGHTIRVGDFVAIDGWRGSVYLGKHEYEPEESYTITI